MPMIAKLDLDIVSPHLAGTVMDAAALPQPGLRCSVAGCNMRTASHGIVFLCCATLVQKRLLPEEEAEVSHS